MEQRNKTLATFQTRGSTVANIEARIIPFVVSTFNRDRHGTVLNQDNWQLDNYRKNPIVGYQHTMSGSLLTPPNPDYIIGKSKNIFVEGSGSNKALIAEVQFEPPDHNPMAEKIFQKVLFGSLNSASVGFIEIGQGKYGTGEEARGGSQETYYFAGQELLEWSIVNVPSNPVAGKRNQRYIFNQDPGIALYAFNKLGGKLRTGEIETLTSWEAEFLIQAIEVGLLDNDIKILYGLRSNPKNMAERMRMQLEYRNITIDIETDRSLYRIERGYNIK